ncbi:class I SAM-dependent methyltransferase [Candidatus Micrarchaeota archaeon]|nr:class I SAM-dependent methyltransferase [Candidatus Micrarchaeota archaeon]
MGGNLSGQEWYDRNAEWYDELHGYYLDYPKIAGLMASRLPRGAKVLDAACGTASLSIELAKRGFKVTAFDLNESMMRVAKRKVSEAGVHVDLRKGDMTTDCFGSFDAVTCLFNAVCHLSPRQLQPALGNFSSQLSKGGLLFFDAFNADYFRLHAKKGRFIDCAHQSGDNFFVRFNDNKYDPGARVLHVNEEVYIQSIYWEKLHESRESYDMQLYSKPQLDSMLEKAGLRVLENFGNTLNLKPFLGDESLFIVTLCEKA